MMQSDTAKDEQDGKSKVPAGTAALAKGLTLLDIIADADEPTRFSELLKLSGLPKPTFARILRTLIVFGLVRQDENKGIYTLGPRFMELSHKVWDTFDLTSVAGTELQRLSQELNETVALCRLDNDKALYLDERSGQGLGVRIATGQRVPLHATAAGKALMAFQDPTTLRRLLQNIELTSFTETTITNEEQLQADLTLIRARGYAVSFEEHFQGVNSVAVAITGKEGQPIGSLAILGPSSRMTESLIHPIGRELIAAARRITGVAGAVAISSQPRPRTNATKMNKTLHCVLPWGAQLGESPVWHRDENKLYWVDILKPSVCRFDPKTGQNDSWDIGKLVSAVMPADDGRLLLATQDGLEWFDFASSSLTPFAHPERGIEGNRLNDAKIGPGGSVWVGSMRLDASQPTGGLYRVTSDGSFEVKETGIAVSNGLGWSPDARTFYFVDTVIGVILAYDTAPGTGELSNKRVFATIPESEGRPDGLTVDAEGGVWVAIWDGWRVNRYLPDGSLDRVIDLPVPRPTSVTFGGQDLTTLYITSARTRLPAATLAEAPLSGGVFACTPGETGIANEPFLVKDIQ
ncbi:SMP-30/gluconolactonase/LRE family protein [Pseudovibrio sp. Tun.PSC04-5.I4]|uniref:SMP-30/gluconolactonase/LRE family protein n=1 Tax=Pseudovibrio sp. Tun.PSC04-5.I4 TaxID=1798213 RepID=UPI00088766DD|nr:SMP-30/gluconolactonase/LRE family protein [Pseudovibrio sp. Tun.PSC04-5.I4]SDR48079.1 Sugar lactone lactonase YvrE [Pseudovibrio sp. Tun.PSC04-5.I4]